MIGFCQLNEDPIYIRQKCPVLFFHLVRGKFEMVRFKMFTLTVALVLHIISPSGAFPFPSIPKLSSWFFRTDGPLGPCPSSCHCNGETASCFKPLPETEVPLPSTIESLWVWLWRFKLIENIVLFYNQYDWENILARTYIHCLHYDMVNIYI